VTQRDLWNQTFAGEQFYYGHEAGPVARRAVRYATLRGEALDAGCGEGQDLALLAESGFVSTGLDFTATGLEKTRRLLAARRLQAEVSHADLATFDFAPWRKRFALVLCVNALQFVGAAAPRALDELAECVAPGGILGLSVFAPGELNAGCDDLWLCPLDELIERLQPRFAMLETAALWQWKGEAAQPFSTLVARRRHEKENA
jgi:SAM-dependent methyltransferase